MANQNSRPKAVVFDMDGLMFNTEDLYWQVGSELLRRRGRQYTRELCDAMMGLQPQPAFQTMIDWHGLSDTWEKLAAESDEIYFSFLDRYPVQVMPGLWELLDALEAAGIPKAIGTSSQRRTLETLLGRFQLQDRFAFTLTAEDIRHSKPHPEIYLKASERFGLPPQEVAVLEDSQAGCRAAIAAGTVAVAVPGPHSRHHDFSQASLVIDTLADRRLYQLLGLSPVGG
ncbi:MAG TPA: HAD family phosphatase [Thermoguttaceae bacterium]|nr:HAD family phosphatase [Thermoguttaceae bacterium]HPP53044.1 HAD family phosphatase [Thermoguttaceae bacterium]